MLRSASKKSMDDGSVVSEQIGMKFGKIVLQVNLHRLTGSVFCVTLCFHALLYCYNHYFPLLDYKYA